MEELRAEEHAPHTSVRMLLAWDVRMAFPRETELRRDRVGQPDGGS
jgi:hypothetical protein